MLQISVCSDTSLLYQSVFSLLSQVANLSQEFAARFLSFQLFWYRVLCLVMRSFGAVTRLIGGRLLCIHNDAYRVYVFVHFKAYGNAKPT
jgi:hypothetical protein